MLELSATLKIKDYNYKQKSHSRTESKNPSTTQNKARKFKEIEPCETAAVLAKFEFLHVTQIRNLRMSDRWWDFSN